MCAGELFILEDFTTNDASDWYTYHLVALTTYISGSNLERKGREKARRDATRDSVILGPLIWRTD